MDGEGQAEDPTEPHPDPGAGEAHLGGGEENAVKETPPDEISAIDAGRTGASPTEASGSETAPSETAPSEAGAAATEASSTEASGSEAGAPALESAPVAAASPLLDDEESDASAGVRGTADLVWSYVFAYAGGVFLLGGLIYSAGIWNFLAYTRLLALLVSGGIIRIHDAHSGYVPGVPQLQLWLQSKDPINFTLILLAVVTFLVFWGIKSAQFHSFCRYVGINGSFGQHARAYLYGQGVNRLQPFNFGLVATASTLEGQGAPPEKAALVVFLGEMFVAIEIIAYAIVGLYLLGWTRWLATLFWPLVILGICHLIVRPAKRFRGMAGGGEYFWRSSREALRMLVREPLTLTKLTLLSWLAFGLEDLAVFLVMMGFTSTHVILTSKTSLILMGVVGSYIARFIPITPGGIGQFEWGFAAAMYMGGASLREVATVAILDNFIRYITGTVLLGGVSLGYGVETKLSNVLAVFRRAADPAQAYGADGTNGKGGRDGRDGGNGRGGTGDGDGPSGPAGSDLGLATPRRGADP